MKRYGYHRTSTREQHLDRGIKEITAYCEQNNLELEKIFTDQQTGKNFNRPRYQVLKEDVLRVGDELIITEVDRLGRNKQETLKELQYYRDNGIRVKILELPATLMDLSKLDNAMARMLMETINNMLIELYAAMAQAEIEKKEKRQREGSRSFVFIAENIINGNIHSIADRNQKCQRCPAGLDIAAYHIRRNFSI